MSTRIFGAVVLGLACMSCRSADPSTSDPKEVFDAQTSLADPEALATFIATTQGILASTGQSGNIPAAQFLGLVPLSDVDRSTLTEGFPGGFSVTCSGQLCTGTADGSGGQGTLLASVHVALFITLSNPTLLVDNHIGTTFVLRGTQGVEFCHVDGMSVQKLGVTQPVKGISDQLQDGALVLQVSNSDADFSCQ